MEEYRAILKLINDTLTSQRDAIEYYRKEFEKSAVKIADLQTRLLAAESANKELSKRLEREVNYEDRNN